MSPPESGLRPEVQIRCSLVNVRFYRTEHECAPAWAKYEAKIKLGAAETLHKALVRKHTKLVQGEA